MIKDTVLFNYFEYDMEMEGKYSIIRTQDIEGVPTEDFVDVFSTIEEATEYAKNQADFAVREYISIVKGDDDVVKDGIAEAVKLAPYVAVLKWVKSCDCCAYLAHEKPVLVTGQLDVAAELNKEFPRAA